MNMQGWEIKNVGDICYHQSSSIVQNKLKNNEGEYPLFGANSLVKRINFYHQDSEYIGIVKDGSGVGRVNIFPAYSSLLGTMQYIFPKYGHLLRYVAYALKSINLSDYATGIAIPHIYYKDYARAKIKIFNSLFAQELIVKELDTLSEIIAKKKNQLAELDTLVQATFYEMFGDPVVNTKDWEVGIIKDTVSSVNYGTSKPANPNGKLKYLRMNNITRLGYLDLKDIKFIDIEEKNLNKYNIKKGDLLFNRTNSKELVGKTAVFTKDEEMVIAGYIIRIRVNNEFNPFYIWGHLNSEYGKSYLKNLCKNIIGMANINAKELQSIPILFPPLSLQNQFAECVEKIEQQKALIEQSIVDVQQLFDSAMDKYFH